MFNLITTIYTGSSKARLKEYKTCLEKNCENPLFEKIIIILEHGNNADCSFIPNHEKIIKLNHSKSKYRPTFKDMLMYSEQYSLNQNKEHRWVLANSDIYFPIWNSHKFAELANLDYKKYNVVLTRYNKTDNYTPEQKKIYSGYRFRYDDVEYTTMWGGNRLVDPHTGLPGQYEGTSIDSWFYTTPLDFEISDSYSTGNDDVRWEDWNPTTGCHHKTSNKNINLDIEIGRDACDQMVNYELSKKKILINPCLNVVSIHEHANWSENTGAYVNIKYRGKTYTREEYKHMMIYDRNFRWGSVLFT